MKSLEEIAFDCAYEGKVDELEYLIVDRGLDVNCTDSFRNKEGANPLVYFAAFFKKNEVLELLHKYKADFNKPNTFGNTAIFAPAADYDGLSTLKLLHKLGANPNHKNNEGILPVKIANDNYQPENTSFLKSVTDKNLIKTMDDYDFSE